MKVAVNMNRANSHGISRFLHYFHVLLITISHHWIILTRIFVCVASCAAMNHAENILFCKWCIHPGNVNPSVVELKFQALENRMSFKSHTGPDNALRCHSDRSAVNQSWLNWESMKIRSDRRPKQFYTDKTWMNRTPTMRGKPPSSVEREETALRLSGQAFSTGNINSQFQ